MAFAALWGLGVMDGLSANLIVKRAANGPINPPGQQQRVPDGTIGYADLDFRAGNNMDGTVGYADLDFGGRSPARPTASQAVVPRQATAAAPTPVRRLDMYSRRLTLSGLRNHERRTMQDDYRSLPLNHPPRTTYPQSCSEKNRSPRILPSPHTKVPVRPDDPGYINANYVRGPDGMPHRYIATQEPLSGYEPGKRGTIGDFWAMIVSHKCRVIVKLNPSVVASAPYVPTAKRPTYNAANVKMTFRGMRQGKGFLVSDILVQTAAGGSFPVSHYQMEAWSNPNVVPREPLLAVLEELERIGRTRVEPILVHCDMGVGRTGVFLALAHGLWQLRKHNGVDVLATVAGQSCRTPRAGVGTVDGGLGMRRSASNSHVSLTSICHSPLFLRTLFLSFCGTQLCERTAGAWSRNMRSMKTSIESSAHRVSLVQRPLPLTWTLRRTSATKVRPTRSPCGSP